MGLVEQTKIILGGLEFNKRGVTKRLPNRKSTPFSLSKHSTPHILIHIVLTECGEKRWDKIGSLKFLQFFLTVAI
jgi:hypothetical protein